MAEAMGLFFFAGLGMTLGVLLIGLLSLIAGGMARKPMKYLCEGVVGGAFAGGLVGALGFITFLIANS